MRLLVYNCVHAADRPPEKRVDTYLEDIFAKLQDIATISQRARVNITLGTGDLFHVKSPARNSHALVQRLIAWARTLEPNPMWRLQVPGNHDLSDGVLESLPRQPLGVIFQAEALRELVGGRLWVDVDDCRYCFVGVPGTHELEEDAEAVRRWVEKRALPADVRIVVAHCSIAPPGWKYWFPVVVPEALAGVADYVFYGHMHDAHGEFEVGDTKFVNYGAVCRGAMTERDLARKPAVYLAEFKGGKLVAGGPVALPSTRSAEEVFRVVEVQRQEEREQAIEEFLAGVKQTSLEKVSVNRVRDEIMKLEDPEVRRLALEVLDSVVGG